MQKKQAGIFIATMFLISFLFFNFVKKDYYINENLKDLNKEEKEYLENFFQFVIRTSTFGYVLFGEKPMGLETFDRHDCLSIEGIDYMDNHHLFNKYRLQEGWRVWQKYAHRFPLKGFSFFSFLLKDNVEEIQIVNHKNFLKCVKEKLNDFHTVLEISLSPQEILDLYIQGEGEIFRKIQNHDGLLGTLLGYGRENSWAFLERKTNPAIKGNPFYKHDFEHDICIFHPMFIVFSNNKDTLKYHTTHEELEKIYRSKDFLTPSLLKLMGQF